VRQPQIRFLTVDDGTRIAWSMQGAGYPLVRVGTFMTHLLHDWESPVWRHWLRDLGTRFTYVRYDERGCGLSTRNPPELSVDAWLGDLEEVIGASGFDRVALLGLSHAAALAVEFAALHPDRVSHVICLGGYATGGSVPDRPANSLELSRVFAEAVRVFWDNPDEMLRRSWSMTLVPDGGPEDVAAIEELMCRSASGDMAATIFELRDRMDVRPLAARVESPVLVAHAERDRMVPFERGMELAALLPNASLLPLDSSNHLLLEEPAWDRFVAETARFVGATFSHADAGLAPSLTEREYEVLALVAEGFSNRDIGEHLLVSTRTVDRHLSNIYRKLGLSGRTARAAAASRLHSL
jgi:pimeloyl-ACP methyl ester carboxylesterase/DNA-binding CsgD family transcriptional regulator